MKQELARVSASLFGDYPISEDHKLWRQDKEFLREYKRLSPGNPYSQDRKYTLREFVRLTSDLRGDLAECGCYQGASAWFMAKQTPVTPLHLFDSFEGLSNSSKEDTETYLGVPYWKLGDLKTSEEVLRENLQEFNNIHVYTGWIPDRFSEVAELRFRLIHIDVDLYQPTKDSLEFFYPRLVEHGVVVLDDYGLLTCPGAYEAVEDFAASNKLYVIHLPTGQGVIIKRND